MRHARGRSVDRLLTSTSGRCGSITSTARPARTNSTCESPSHDTCSLLSWKSAVTAVEPLRIRYKDAMKIIATTDSCKSQHLFGNSICTLVITCS